MVAATILCALAVAALVEAERSERATLRFAAKPIASCAFVAVAVIAVAHRTHGDRFFETSVIVGLVLGLVGDVALLFKRGFIPGLVAFLVGHLAYAFAVQTACLGIEAWPAAAGVYTAAPIIAGGAVLVHLWPRLGSMRGPVIAYVIAIVTMVIAALAAWRAGYVPPIFAVGAVLFFASDYAVARDKFVASSFVNKAWGLPAYYAAQLLIAWSLRAVTS